MSFSDKDLERLKGNLSRFGVYPGIDICNYFDEVYEIEGLVARLEEAEAVLKNFEPNLIKYVGRETYEAYYAWLKSKADGTGSK